MARVTIRIDEIDVRDGEGGAQVIAGRAAPFGQWSQELRTQSGQRFRERIAPTAFDRALAGGDVLALWQHDPAMPLARTRSGTLRLWKDDTGLRFEMSPEVQTSWGRDAVVTVRAGLVDSMSFGFRVAVSGMSEERGDNDVYERTLHDVDLREISLVTWPAYPGTAVMVRTAESTDDEYEFAEHVIERDRQEPGIADADSVAMSARARLQAMTDLDIQFAARRIDRGE